MAGLVLAGQKRNFKKMKPKRTDDVSYQIVKIVNGDVTPRFLSKAEYGDLGRYLTKQRKRVSMPKDPITRPSKSALEWHFHQSGI